MSRTPYTVTFSFAKETSLHQKVALQVWLPTDLSPISYIKNYFLLFLKPDVFSTQNYFLKNFFTTHLKAVWLLIP